MTNSMVFFPDYNPYSMIDTHTLNSEAATGDQVLIPCQSSSITTIGRTPTASAIAPIKRKTIDTDTSYSPTSTYSDNSNYSDTYSSYFNNSSYYSSTGSATGGAMGGGNTGTNAHSTTSPEDASSDEDASGGESDDVVRKRKKHTEVEAQRRAQEKAHFRELLTLIGNRNDPKVNKLHHLDLLKIAAQQLTEMNNQHQHDPLRPSNLTDNELNFLTIEASNSFLFVTLLELPIPSFRIIHITESIRRILKYTPEQWHGQNLFSFIHPNDALRVQNQLLSQHQSSRRPGVKSHIECRIKQGNSDESYVPVIIDGITKMIDQTLQPVPNNVPGILAFIAVCHLPLITKYSETNAQLYRDPHSLTFRCRCSPQDWKIFLVDRSVSTLPSLSFDTFHQKSILEFIHPSEQTHVHQALLHSTASRSIEKLPCHFVYPLFQSLIPMTLEIRSFYNPVVHRAEFVELTFTNLPNSMNQTSVTTDTEDTKLPIPYLDFVASASEIDELLRLEPSSEQPNEHPNLNLVSSTTGGLDDLFPDWVPKNESY